MSEDIDALLERSLWDTFWLPSWARMVSTPEVTYTASERDEPGLNQVLRVRSGPRLVQRVADVSAAHRGVSSQWLLARESQLPELPELLLDRGYQPGHVHNVRSVRAEAFSAAPSPGVTVRRVRDEPTLRDCIAVCERAFGQEGPGPSPERLAKELAMADGPGARVQRFVAYDEDGQPMSSGGLNVHPSLGLGFLWGGGTDPRHRGRGAYRALVAARIARAAQLGCPVVAIYARLGTSDPIMEKLGFERGGTMTVWSRAADAVPWRAETEQT